MTQKRLLLALFCCVCTTLAAAQNSPWQFAYENGFGNFYGIFSLDKDRFFTTGEWGTLYKSTDGALTMEPIHLDSNLSIFSDIIFPDALHGVAGGGCYFVTDECLQNVLATTNDGGQTWAVEQLSATNAGVFHFLDYLPDGTVFAMADYAGLFRRNPGATTWDSLGRPDGALVGAYLGMQFLDHDHGFVEYWTTLTGPDGDHLLRTEDGGISWQEVYTSESNGDGPNFVFVTPQKGFQLAAFGQLGRSNDGGLNWTFEQTFATTEDIRKLDFVDQQVAYLSTWDESTQKSRIYRTDNGGDNWSVDLELNNVYINDFHFSDIENGYATVNFTTIYKRSGMVAVEAAVQEPIAVAPNPFTDKIALLHSDGTEDISLFNAVGQLIWSGKQIERQDFSGLATGVYFINIAAPAPVVLKLIKIQK